MRKLKFLIFTLIGLCFSPSAKAYNVQVIRSPKQLCSIAPVWKRETIEYSDKLEKSGVPITYKELSGLFNSMLFFDYDKQKYGLWFRQNETAQNAPEEPAAFLLGKVRINDDVCGLLVLENGYYSKTEICLYPIKNDGTVLRALVLADYWGDDGTEITIKGKIIHPSSDATTVNVNLKRIDSSDDAKPTDKPEITNESFIFPFDEKQGFLLTKSKS